ncbi:hypothetical protein CVT26_001002, partial [Gymnopilus dilepis]
ALITARLVSHHWRHLISLAPIHPTRRRLLSLYHTVLAHPRPDALAQEYLHAKLDSTFDSEAYIAALLAQNPEKGGVPEEFSMWVLEWPERVCINGMWPGLPFTMCGMDTNATAGSSRRYGANYLAVRPPVVSGVGVMDSEARLGSGSGIITATRASVPMLPIWTSKWQEMNLRKMDGTSIATIKYTGLDDDPSASPHSRFLISSNPPYKQIKLNCETWLVLDSSSPHHGKVLEAPCDSLSHASTVTLSPSALGVAPSACPDWIEYLEQRWFGRTSESKGAVLPRFIADLAMKRVDSSDLEGR